MKTCKHCGKSLDGQVQFHRNHNIFCDSTCATLFDYSDLNPIIRETKSNLLDAQPDGFIHWSSKDGTEMGGGG